MLDGEDPNVTMQYAEVQKMVVPFVALVEATAIHQNDANVNLDLEANIVKDKDSNQHLDALDWIPMIPKFAEVMVFASNQTHVAAIMAIVVNVVNAHTNEPAFVPLIMIPNARVVSVVDYGVVPNNACAQHLLVLLPIRPRFVPIQTHQPRVPFPLVA